MSTTMSFTNQLIKEQGATDLRLDSPRSLTCYQQLSFLELVQISL